MSDNKDDSKDGSKDDSKGAAAVLPFAESQACVGEQCLTNNHNEGGEQGYSNGDPS